MTSGELILKIRRSMCLERHEFAALFGKSKQAIWQWEKDMRHPRLMSIRKLLELAKKEKIKAAVEDFL